MTTLRQAAQQALEALTIYSDAQCSPKGRNAITALREALEKSEPPPEWEGINNIIAEYGLQAIDFVSDWKAAQRPWQGLTDEEIWSVVSRIGTSDSNVNPLTVLSDARAIEQRLKERNT